MNALDVIIIVVLLFGMVKGWMSGFFRQIASIAGVILGLLLATMLYITVGDWLAPQIGMVKGVARALAFILIWVGVPLALSIVAYFLTKTAETLCLDGINRLGGALVGGLKYVVFLSCVLNVGIWLQIMDKPENTKSHLYAPMTAISGVLFDYCADHFREAAKEHIETNHN